MVGTVDEIRFVLDVFRCQNGIDDIAAVKSGGLDIECHVRHGKTFAKGFARLEKDGLVVSSVDEEHRRFVFANDVWIVDGAPQGYGSVCMGIDTLFAINVHAAEFRSARFVDVTGKVCFFADIDIFEREDSPGAVAQEINAVRVNA